MARIAHIQSSFASGELSPRFRGRVDMAQYRNGLALCENMLVLRHGCVARRPGLRFVAETKDALADAAARLLPFVFGPNQAYVLELGAGYARFFADRGALAVEPTPAAVANGDFALPGGWIDASQSGATATVDAGAQRLVLTPGAAATASARQQIAALVPGREHVLHVSVERGPVRLAFGASAGSAELADRRELAAGEHLVAFVPTAASAWLAIDAAAGAAVPRRVRRVAFHAPGPLEIPLPYAAGDLEALMSAQTADVMYLVHDAHPPRRLARFGHRSWSSTEAPTRDGPYLSENGDDAHTVAPAATSGLGVGLVSSKDLFRADDVGRSVRLKHAAKWGWGRVSAVHSPVSASVDIVSAFGGTDPVPAWRLGAWGGPRGWPRAVAFHQQRLFFAGSANQPQTVWASRPADFADFAPTVAADGNPDEHISTDECGLAYTVASDQVAAIQWLAPLRDLMIGTGGGEFRLSGGEDRALAPGNAQIRHESAHGSARIKPVRAANALLFVHRARRKIRELAFNADVDGYSSPDATLVSEHLTAPGIREIAWQQEPEGLLWLCTADGGLACLTFERSQQMLAWHRHSTDGKVRSLACVPGGADESDRLWMLVRRRVGEADRTYVEFLERVAEARREDAFLVDSGLSYGGPPAATVSGLGHLAGRTVEVLADGAAHPPCLVDAAGRLALARPAATVQAGLGYVSAIETLPPEQAALVGTAQTKTKRIHAAAVRLLASAAPEISAPGGPPVAAAHRPPATPMGRPAPLLTGDVEVEFPGGYEADGRIRVEQRQPLPLTVLATVVKLYVSDGS